MSEFPLVSLGSCCDVVSGATPKTGVASYWDGEVLWATPADLSKLVGRYIEDTPRKITDIGLGSCAATVLPPGSVLLSSRAPIGHVAINTRPMATNQGFKSLVPNTDKVDAGYLYSWLQANRSYLEMLGNGATFKELSKATVQRIEIPLPPLDMQRRISDVLYQADSLRAMRLIALDKLNELARSIFFELFGEPGTNPYRWPELSFQQVLAESPRNGLSPSNGGEVSAKVLTLSAITGSRFDGSAFKVGTFKTAPPAHQAVSRGDFLVCRGNGNIDLVGRGYFPDADMPDVTFPDTIIASRTNPAVITREYLEVIWATPAVRRQIEASARTTNGTFKINQKSLEAVRIMVPPLERQRTFAERMAWLGWLRASHAVSSAVLDELFASLQHRAFRSDL